MPDVQRFLAATSQATLGFAIWVEHAATSDRDCRNALVFGSVLLCGLLSLTTAAAILL